MSTAPIRYERSPLITVECQLRFPPILAINEVAPAKFQEEIRNKYPLYSCLDEQQVSLSFESGGAGTFPAARVGRSNTIRKHYFATADAAWGVYLTSSYLAVSTTRYSTWSDYLARVNEAVDVLNRVYAPIFFERVGLRYINAILHSKLDMSADTPWNSLILPHVLGFLSRADYQEITRGYSSTTEIRHNDNTVTRVIAALGRVQTNKETAENLPDEIGFIVDTDSFSGRCDLTSVTDNLNVLHKNADKIFQSVITDRLRAAMETKGK